MPQLVDPWGYQPPRRPAVRRCPDPEGGEARRQCANAWCCGPFASPIVRLDLRGWGNGKRANELAAITTAPAAAARAPGFRFALATVRHGEVLYVCGIVRRELRSLEEAQGLAERAGAVFLGRGAATERRQVMDRLEQ